MKVFLFKAWMSLCGLALVAVAPDAISAVVHGAAIPPDTQAQAPTYRGSHPCID